MNPKDCAAGRNEFGQWHIAGASEGAPALLILQNMKYTDILSPLGVTYFRAARWICAHGGAVWTTNVLGLPTTCLTLPSVDPF